MKKEFIKFELGMSGTGHATHIWTIDTLIHTDSDIRNLAGVIVQGLFQTDEDKELSQRYFKIIGSNTHVQWASKRIQGSNPEIRGFNIPSSFIEE